MTMPWFRMFNESRNDRKLDTLADDEFRVWHKLLCCASEGKDRGTLNSDDFALLAIEVARGDEELLARTLERLVKLKIIKDNGETVTFLNFLKRNYDKPSDTPQATAERQRRHREKGRDEGVTETVSRVVTPGHAQEETRREETRVEETIPPSSPPRPLRPDPSPPDGGVKVRAVPKPKILRADQEPGFERWYATYPNRQHRPDAERAYRKLDPDADLYDRLLADIPLRLAGRKWADGYIEHPATYLNQRIWEDDIEPQRLASTRASPNGKQSATAGFAAIAERFKREADDGPGHIPDAIDVPFAVREAHGRHPPRGA